MKNARRTIAGRSIRWDPERTDAAYRSGYWISTTLGDALAEAARDTPERVLIVDGPRKLTAAELHGRAMALAHALLDRYPNGSTVSFMLPNWHEAAIIYLGVTLAGMVAHPVLPSLRARDLEFILTDVESRILFVPEQLGEENMRTMLAEVGAHLSSPPDLAFVRAESREGTRFEQMLAHPVQGELPQLDPDAVRMIMYTSGTTGRPKGVMHSHNSLHALIRQIGQHWLVDPGDRFLVASPISHIGGSIYAFEMPLLLGTTAILMERWNPDQAIGKLLDQRCTHFAGATPFLVQTLAAARSVGTRLPDLKLFVCGGASVPPSLIRQAAAYFERARVTRVYGSTEVPVTTVGDTSPSGSDLAAETDGEIGIARLKLATHSGQSSGVEPESGEVLVCGPQMLVGYVHPEDEATAFDPDGYYRTGDVGRRTGSNHLVITGRIKDIIIRNGENIAPKEVEDLLIDHPDIAEVAIVGLPHPRTGEQACAVIVPRGSAQLDVSTLADFLEAREIAKFKRPERVELWPQLPKNAAGKVLKQAIRETLLSTDTISRGQTP